MAGWAFTRMETTGPTRRARVWQSFRAVTSFPPGPTLGPFIWRVPVAGSDTASAAGGGAGPQTPDSGVRRPGGARRDGGGGSFSPAERRRAAEHGAVNTPESD